MQRRRSGALHGMVEYESGETCWLLLYERGVKKDGGAEQRRAFQTLTRVLRDERERGVMPRSTERQSQQTYR